MITILDKTFVFKIAKAAIPGNFTMWGYFDPLTQGAAKDLILRLLKDVNFKRWNLSPATLANESITQAMSEVAGTADASP
jgi:hypothetical protein